MHGDADYRLKTLFVRTTAPPPPITSFAHSFSCIYKKLHCSSTYPTENKISLPSGFRRVALERNVATLSPVQRWSLVELETRALCCNADLNRKLGDFKYMGDVFSFVSFIGVNFELNRLASRLHPNNTFMLFAESNNKLQFSSMFS